MVINKGNEALDATNPKQIFSYRRSALEIKNLKVEWKKKNNEHKIKSYSSKEKSRLHQESNKYNLLEKFKQEKYPGPFTNTYNESRAVP